MGSFLTSKQTQTQSIDPTLERESRSLMSLFRMLAGGGHQYNRGETIAAFTPQQEAAMAGTQAAAGAFGMPAAAGGATAGMPTPTTSASGVRGYSVAPEVERSKSLLPKEFTDMLTSWRQRAGTPTKQKRFSSGGKK